MSRRKFGGVRLAVALVAICATIAGGVYLINERAVESLLKQNARETSKSVAHYFEKNLLDVEAIVKGATPSEASIKFIRAGIEAKGVHNFKLYSAAGRLMLDNEQLVPGHKGEDALGTHNPRAFAAISNNESFVNLEEEIEDGETQLIAETYVPIVRNGKTIGASEVYIDKTADAALFRRNFAWTSLLIALLASLGFAAPAFGFHLRTRQKLAADDNVRFLATHDVLTALPNRASFTARLIAGLNGSADPKHFVAAHFIDLDFFKEINDQHGHEFGDAVLQAVASRLKGTLREGDLVSRFGGDEFVIAQVGLCDYEQLASATQRIIKAFKDPLRIHDRDIVVTASIGTAVSLPDGDSADQLIANADTAVYVVKARGRNGHCFFEPKFNEEKRKRMELEAIVRKAVAAQSFELHFQPLYKFERSEIKGFEALLRLRNDQGQSISPAEFIPVAEEIGLIDEIGGWVLEQACRVAAGWPEELQISVNLSVAQFRRRNVLSSTRSALAKSGLAPSRLLLEITESLLLVDTEAALEQLRDLKALGVSIVMDDFGTGYSSLGYMLKFPFDRIKIDRSFINQLEAGNENANTLIQTIITLGHTLHMNVTAEGVETPAQAAALRDMQCDDAQGYLFGKPMPESDIPALLMKAFATRTGIVEETAKNSMAAA